MTDTLPIGPGGAAGPLDPFLAGGGPLVVTDLTGSPRFGIRGPGALAWWQEQGPALPEINRRHAVAGGEVLRLGYQDLMMLGPGADRLAEHWRSAGGAKGHDSHRDAALAWLRVGGPWLHIALTRLCALDLRPQAAPTDRLWQTRFAGLNAVVLRDADAVQILFDIASTAVMLHRVEAVARELET